MPRYYAHQIGKYEGSGIYMYDDNGEGIRDKRYLDNVLNKWISLGNDYPKNFTGLTIYVVQADVHY